MKDHPASNRSSPLGEFTFRCDSLFSRAKPQATRPGWESNPLGQGCSLPPLPIGHPAAPPDGGESRQERINRYWSLDHQAGSAGLEPADSEFKARRFYLQKLRASAMRPAGLEPASSPWRGGALPVSLPDLRASRERPVHSNTVICGHFGHRAGLLTNLILPRSGCRR